MTYTKMMTNYDRSSVETAGRLELVILCYDKAIQLIMQAKAHFEAEEFEEKARRFQKALAIIHELQSCLNLDEGGQIAKNLDAIYGYITRRLLLADIKRELAGFDEAVHILSELKEAWEAISSDSEEQIDDMPTVQPPLKLSSAQIAA